MFRREFITLFGGALWPFATRAQGQSKIFRVGTSNALLRPQWQALERRMAELGYLEGSNYVIDYVQIPRATEAEYKAGYLKLIERGVDIIVSGGPAFLLESARAVAGSRPIVMVAIDYDPLARAYVKSLARPGW